MSDKLANIAARLVLAWREIFCKPVAVWQSQAELWHLKAHEQAARCQLAECAVCRAVTAKTAYRRQ